MNKIMGILMLLVYICVATALLSDAFVGAFNMANTLRWTALHGILAVGAALVIITGGIDLSIGSLISLTGCLLAIFLIDYQWSVPFSLLMVLGISALVGVVHGLLITKLRLQPFIVTLCGLLIYRGIAREITEDQVMGFGRTYDDSLRLLATGKPCSVAFLLLAAGIGITIYGVIRFLRRDSQVKLGNPVRWESIVFTLIAGVMLTVIGGSRYTSDREITTGDTLINVGFEIKTFSVSVPEEAADRPAELMGYCGLLAIPCCIWLLFLLYRRGYLDTRMTQLVGAVVISSILVWLAARSANGTGWPELLSVFGSLGLFMAFLGWFGSAARKALGSEATVPLQAIGFFSILYLIGQTPLGKTLVPSPMFFLFVLGTLAAIFLNKTIYGRYLLALGSNVNAARFSGINTDVMIILSYVICSTIAGIGGILFALETNSIQPLSHANFYELYAIAAAVLGGCSLRGGEGNITGVIIGAALIRTILNSSTMLGFSNRVEFLIIGVVILIGVIADEIVKRIVASARLRESQMADQAARDSKG